MLIGTAVALVAGMAHTDNITDTQIHSLRREALAHGDDLMALVCSIALAGALTEYVDPGDHRAALEALGIIPEHIDADLRARAECARAINAGKG